MCYHRALSRWLHHVLPSCDVTLAEDLEAGLGCGGKGGSGLTHDLTKQCPRVTMRRKARALAPSATFAGAPLRSRSTKILRLVELTGSWRAEAGGKVASEKREGSFTENFQLPPQWQVAWRPSHGAPSKTPRSLSPFSSSPRPRPASALQTKRRAKRAHVSGLLRRQSPPP